MRLAIVMIYATVAAAPFFTANAENFSTIHKFDDATGSNSSGKLVQDRNGALYGVVHFFGQGNNGAVFQLVPPAPGKDKWVENILYSFTGDMDGASPVGGLVRAKSGTLSARQSSAAPRALALYLPSPQSALSGRRPLSTISPAPTGFRPAASSWMKKGISTAARKLPYFS
jgi:hypothetical protein